MYDIGICDDKKDFCSSVENMISEFAKERAIPIHIQIWYAGEEIRDYLAVGGHLDILFLDIELFKMTGIEVGRYIRNELNNMELQLIYMSRKPSCTQQLFRTQPMDFLLKPIAQEQINDTIATAIKIIKRKSVRFEFKQGREYYYIPRTDIVYFESSGRKIKIVSLQGIYEFYGRLKDIIKELSENFIEIHQSYIVNWEHVLRYSYDMVEMENGTILTISSQRRRKVRERVLGSPV